MIQTVPVYLHHQMFYTVQNTTVLQELSAFEDLQTATLRVPCAVIVEVSVVMTVAHTITALIVLTLITIQLNMVAVLWLPLLQMIIMHLLPLLQLVVVVVDVGEVGPVLQVVVWLSLSCPLLFQTIKPLIWCF